VLLSALSHPVGVYNYNGAANGKQAGLSVVNETIQFLVKHGLPILFAAVFVEQTGVPLPAAPWLLAAGALIGTSQIGWLGVLGAAWFGSILPDLIWFYLGRHYGTRALGFLCRVSLEPDSCVRRTQNVITRYGMKGIIVAKFFPGLSTLAPPLAGSSGVGVARFFFFDGLGSFLYAGTFLLLGFLFSAQLELAIAVLSDLGGRALAIIVSVAAAYIGYKYFQRRRLLRELRAARITVAELRQKLDAGENPVILDLRSSTELERDSAVIQGAIHLLLDDIEKRHHELPRDQDIVVYCSCPNEITAARVALLLQRKGFTRVRPLLGGIDAWRKQNYPMDLRATTPGLPAPPPAIKA
jgi:membrane protein DedA with SNARE-associated domain/rhodanese-related sulfurtransferase